MLIFGTAAYADDFAPGYDLIRCGGSSVIRRGAINFTDSGATCTDDSSNNETEVSGLGGGGVDSITVNTTAATNANFKDGTYIAFSIDTGATPDDITASIVADSVGATELADADFGDFTCADGAGGCLIDANAVALATDTTGNYVATIADAGNANITVANSGTENAAITLDVVDVTCTGCLGTTEVAGLDVSADINLTAGDNLTLTDDDLDLDAAVSIATSITSPIFSSNNADPADAGIFRLGNAETITWEASPAGTDETLTVSSAENFQISGPIEIDASDPADAEAIRLDNAEGIAWEASPAGTDCTLKLDSSEILQSSCALTTAGVLATTGGLTLDANTEANIEAGVDLAGEVTAVDLDNTVIADSVAVTDWNLTTPTITTQFTLTAQATPTTDADGECALDTDGWGTGFDAYECFNGTASAYLVATTASDTPSNGQVPKFNTGGSITWEDDADSGGATAWNAIGDAAAAGSIDFAGNDQDIISAEDGGDILTITTTDLDQASDTTVLRLATNDTSDANTRFVIGTIDEDGTPANDWIVAASGTAGGLVQQWGSLGLTVTTDGDGAVEFLGTSTGSDECLSLNLDDTSNQAVFGNCASSSSLTDVTFSGLDITVGGGNINTGNIALVVGDATTDSVTLTTDGTGTAEVALPAGSIDGTEILDDTVDSADYAANSIDDEHLATTESINLPIYSAKITGAFVVRTPTSGDASTQGAQIDAGDGNWRLLFDPTTDEAAVWQFRLPDYWAAHSEVNIQYSMTSATANEVDFEVDVMCITPGDSADVGTASFPGVATASDTVPGTAGFPDEVSVTVTDDSCAAGDLMFLYLSKDANDATNDDATGDTEVIGLEYEFTR